MQMKLKSAAIVIIIANIIFFLIQNLLSPEIINSLLLTPAAFAQPWRFLTSMFMHGGVNHLFFNMYALLIFGPLVEQRMGTKRFIFNYFVAGLAAGIGHIILSFLIYGVVPPALGASGAIMGILGVTIMLLPDLKVLFMFFIPMSLRTAGILFALVDVVGIFYPTGIANFAHLVGLATGLLYGYFLLHQKKTFSTKFAKPIVRHGFTVNMNDSDIDEYLKNGRL